MEHLRGGLASSLSRYLTRGAKFHLGIVEEEEEEHLDIVEVFNEEEEEEHLVNCDDCEM